MQESEEIELPEIVTAKNESLRSNIRHIAMLEQTEQTKIKNKQKYKKQKLWITPASTFLH